MANRLTYAHSRVEYGMDWNRRSCLLVCIAALGACRSVEITPAALRAEGGRTQERAAALERWREAVDLANEFLRSPWCRTLPRGHYSFADEGLTYESAGGREWPIEVRSTGWGDLVVAWGFRAQEGERGFCVGGFRRREGDRHDVLLDNSFFRDESGAWHDSASLADVTLHETAHVVHRAGTIGFWNTIGYYAVAVATLRGADHPAEDRPNATSEEFSWFWSAKQGDAQRRAHLETFTATHLGSRHPHCEHGPFPEPP